MKFLLHEIQKNIGLLMQKKRLDATTVIFLLAGVVCITTLGLGAWFGARYFWSLGSVSAVIDDAEEVNQLQDEAQLCLYRRRADGVCVSGSDQIETKLTAVMIENSADAWPLSGLAAANIVYEAPTEGDIPRFMALYTDDSVVEKVGPVRSARPYYLDWLSEYGTPMYMHVGGSPEALQRIERENFFDINEFYRGWYFWRSDDRARPHNTFTSAELWSKARSDYETYYPDIAYDVWTFGDMSPCALSCATRVTASFLSPTYDATWEYVADRGRYIRYQNGQQQFDGEAMIEADTIIIQRVNAVTVDEIGRKRIHTIGRGEALVFRDGYTIEGTWKKDSREGRTQFYDADGTVIPLKSGKIWVEVLPQNNRVSIQ